MRHATIAYDKSAITLLPYEKMGKTVKKIMYIMSTQHQLTSYQRHIVDILAFLTNLVKKSNANLMLSGTFPIEILHGLEQFYRLYDDSCHAYLAYRKKLTGENISCHHGCAWCCYQMPYGVYSFEYIYLYHGIFKVNPKSLYLPRILDRCEHFSSEITDTTTINFQLFETYLSKNKPCPFLNVRNRSCELYAYRPLICRSHFSFVLPHHCHPRRYDRNHDGIIKIESSENVYQELCHLDKSLPFKLSPILSFGILEFIVNVMQCKQISWLGLDI